MIRIVRERGDAAVRGLVIQPPVRDVGVEEGGGDGGEGAPDYATFWEGGLGDLEEDGVEELGWEGIHHARFGRRGEWEAAEGKDSRTERG